MSKLIRNLRKEKETVRKKTTVYYRTKITIAEIKQNLPQ